MFLIYQAWKIRIKFYFISIIFFKYILKDEQIPAVISHCDRKRMSNKFTIQWTSIDWILFILVSNRVREKFPFNISLFAYTLPANTTPAYSDNFHFFKSSPCVLLTPYTHISLYKREKENDLKCDNFFWITNKSNSMPIRKCITSNDMGLG